MSNHLLAGFDGYNATIDLGYGAYFLIPKGLGYLLASNVSVSSVLYVSDSLFVNSSSNGKVASSVLSLQVGGLDSGVTFSPAIQVLINISVAQTHSSSITCAYYNFTTFSWKTDGCTRVANPHSNASIICNCTHLTNFAVLLDFNGGSVSAADLLALGLISTIGLSISVALMGLTVLVFLLFPV